MLSVLFIVHVVVAVASKATVTGGFWGHLITIGEVAGAIGAITAVGVFLWSRLRLDKGWAWIQKNIKADQRAARLAEFFQAQADPKVVELRKAELKGVLEEQIIPQLVTLKSNQESLAEGHQTLHDCIDRNTQSTQRVESKVEQIVSEQDRVATELQKAQAKVDQVGKGLLEDRQIMRDHISDDKIFQEKSEVIWKHVPGLLKSVENEKKV